MLMNMKQRFCHILQLLVIISAFSGAVVDAQHSTETVPQLRLNAADAKINNKTVKFVSRKEFGKTKLAELKPAVAERIADDAEDNPDAVFRFRAPESGIYEISTHVLRAKEVKRGEPVETLSAKIQIDGRRPTRRIVSDIHEYSHHILGRFQLTGETQELKIWLPEGILLNHIDIKKHTPMKVPSEAVDYTPRILPPETHPRLWVTGESLPTVRERLTKGENKHVWAKITEKAGQPFFFEFDIRKEISHNSLLENAVQIKAFYYLMTGNQKIGEESVKLLIDYLSVLEFGNVKTGDITRKVGNTIYTSALVYDWCYDLIDEKERESLYSCMMRLAGEMEIDWPPFKENIVSGHASEAQVNRDLLAMSIAIYSEDAEPYRYVSYLIHEKLVPMRAFEYQSPRHSQGIDYGAYRHAWEMHAAWLFYRMSGIRVFNENIASLTKYWLYMRLPNGEMLRDGDVFSKNGSYWKMPETMFLDYTYNHDPVIKGEFERQGGIPENPLLFLLLNNPELKAEHDKSSLPLTLDFGHVLGGIIARTGWDMTENSNDVVAEIKGGGYHFGNHQHSDAGAVQLYYRGRQVCGLGIYYSYGTPYDFGYNKRSVSHSMMLVKDPNEKLLFRAKTNDGGTIFNQRTPESPHETMTDPWFYNGTVLSVDFGPSKINPAYSYFKADLTGAYTSKVSNYNRRFLFLNLEREDIPAAVILADDMHISKEELPVYWKINTIKEPLRFGTDIVLQNEKNGLVGKTHINMLLPLPEDREIELSSIRDSTSVLGYQYHIPSNLSEANGYQVVAYQKNRKKNHCFLTVLQVISEDTKPLAVKFYEKDKKYFITLSDRIVCMSANSELIQTPFTVDAVGNQEYQVLLTDLKPGFWNVFGENGKVNLNIRVESGKNTLLFKAVSDNYKISPGRSYDGVE